MRLRSGDKHHLRKSSDRKSTNQSGEWKERLPDLCFSIWRFSKVVFIPRAQPHAQSLFSISNSFWYKFDSFLQWEERRSSRKFDRLFRCFHPLSRHLTEVKRSRFPEDCELFQIVQRFWQRKVWTQRHLRGEKPRCKFLARKSAKFFANFSVLARKSANFFANFSATKVTSLPSISLSLSLSLSHLTHLTHNIGSASALPIILSMLKIWVEYLERQRILLKLSRGGCPPSERITHLHV